MYQKNAWILVLILAIVLVILLVVKVYLVYFSASKKTERFENGNEDTCDVYYTDLVTECDRGDLEFSPLYYQMKINEQNQYKEKGQPISSSGSDELLRLGRLLQETIHLQETLKVPCKLTMNGYKKSGNPNKFGPNLANIDKGYPGHYSTCSANAATTLSNIPRLEAKQSSVVHTRDKDGNIVVADGLVEATFVNFETDGVLKFYCAAAESLATVEATAVEPDLGAPSPVQMGDTLTLAYSKSGAISSTKLSKADMTNWSASLSSNTEKQAYVRLIKQFFEEYVVTVGNNVVLMAKPIDMYGKIIKVKEDVCKHMMRIIGPGTSFVLDIAPVPLIQMVKGPLASNIDRLNDIIDTAPEQIRRSETERDQKIAEIAQLIGDFNAWKLQGNGQPVTNLDVSIISTPNNPRAGSLVLKKLLVGNLPKVPFSPSLVSIANDAITSRTKAGQSPLAMCTPDQGNRQIRCVMDEILSIVESKEKEVWKLRSNIKQWVSDLETSRVSWTTIMNNYIVAVDGALKNNRVQLLESKYEFISDDGNLYIEL